MNNTLILHMRRLVEGNKVASTAIERKAVLHMLTVMAKVAEEYHQDETKQQVALIISFYEKLESILEIDKRGSSLLTETAAKYLLIDDVSLAVTHSIVTATAAIMKTVNLFQSKSSYLDKVKEIYPSYQLCSALFVHLKSYLKG